MKGGPVAWLATAALVLLSTPATAQAGFDNPTTPTPVELYFHLDGFQEFPINTQRPVDLAGGDAGVGITTHTSSCLPDAPYAGNDYHTMYGFSSPSYVEYDDAEAGRPRYHPERELSYAIEFSLDQPPVLHWFLSTWTGVSSVAGADPNTAPVVVPQVRVQATLRTGGEVALGPEGYDVGAPFASGTSETALLAGDQSQGAIYSDVDGTPVYELVVPLAYESDSVLPAVSGYTLEVTTYLDNPACDPQTGHVMPNVVRVHSSVDHRPRLTTTVLNPLRIEYVHPQVLGDGLAIHIAANSPFGNYDVNESRVEVAIEGPSPASSIALATFTQHTHGHDRHGEAADFAFLWQFRKDGAQPGNYTVTVTAHNDQGTATATATAVVAMADAITVTGCGSSSEPTATSCSTERVDGLGNPLDQAKPSPGAGLVVLLLVLGAAVAARRA